MGSFIAQLRAWATWPTLLLLAACSTGKAEQARTESFRVVSVEQTSVRKDNARPYYWLVLVWAVTFHASSRVRIEKAIAQELERRGVKAGMATAHITSKLTATDLDAVLPAIQAGDGYEALLVIAVDPAGAAYSAFLFDYSDPAHKVFPTEGDWRVGAVWEASGHVEIDTDKWFPFTETLDAVAREAPPRIVEAMVKDGLIR